MIPPQTLFDSDLTLEDAQELIKNGEDVNVRCGSGYTPLHFIQNVDVVKLLIDHGADVNAQNDVGKTPLFYAINENIEIVRLLIKNGADVNAKNNDGNTPLFSVKKNDIAQLLIDHGAKVNITNQFGETPFFYELSHNIFKVFIENGMNLNARDSDNRTALDFCENVMTIQFFIHHGAIPGEIATYIENKDFFSEEQQNAFDIYMSITSNDEDFFQMCLAFQNNKKNNIEIKEMDIL